MIPFIRAYILRHSHIAQELIIMHTTLRRMMMVVKHKTIMFEEDPDALVEVQYS